MKAATSQILQTRAAYAWHPAHKNHSSLLKRIRIQKHNKRNDEDDEEDDDDNDNDDDDDDDDDDNNNNNNNNNNKVRIFTTKDDVNSFQIGQCCVDASCFKRINKV